MCTLGEDLTEFPPSLHTGSRQCARNPRFGEAGDAWGF
jgi:hypothetical protein